ncbi:protein of unknown function [Acetoanaerobium sticklandii]|uniref:Uncharacterized protein n=1 Tax=Acetoanaerobium sticklandii (strain ATCC 12662 / DSM 519 / JCM 1433 / CCUG 9281 / NCIMB 10654 / HF) TaxID=499177 RepID=E3PUW4_ACESD|nr:protein of unknown function [Acetoanaerobium sticklandii]
MTTTRKNSNSIFDCSIEKPPISGISNNKNRGTRANDIR